MHETLQLCCRLITNICATVNKVDIKFLKKTQQKLNSEKKELY